MKTRNLTILFLALFAFGNLFAQDEDSDEKDSDVDCSRELSIFAQDGKAEDYESAKPHYDKLVDNCPDMHRAIYQYGKRMFNHFIDEAKENDDKEAQKEYSEGLIKNYELELEHFPDKVKKGNTYARIAQLEYDNDIGSLEEQYDAFDKAWEADSESFTDPKALYTYFSIAIDLQDEDKKELDEVFIKYDDIMSQINTEEADWADAEHELRIKKDSLEEELDKKEQTTLKNAELYLKNYVRIKESIDEKIGSRADCDKLVPLYADKFDENEDDEEWLKLAAHRLSAKKCTSGEEGELFVKVTEALHDIEPSAKSAKYLGQLAAHEGDTQNAVKYYEESAELEDNDLDKASVYYLLGNMYNDQGQQGQARANYRKALSFDRSLGQAHLKIASLYADSANDCGETTFEKQAVYWLAAQEADRAGQVDPSLQSSAEQSAEAYRGRAPSKSDVFKEGKKGETITIGCWINDQIQVPE